MRVISIILRGNLGLFSAGAPQRDWSDSYNCCSAFRSILTLSPQYWWSSKMLDSTFTIMHNTIDSPSLVNVHETSAFFSVAPLDCGRFLCLWSVEHEFCSHTEESVSSRTESKVAENDELFIKKSFCRSVNQPTAVHLSFIKINVVQRFHLEPYSWCSLKMFKDQNLKTGAEPFSCCTDAFTLGLRCSLRDLIHPQLTNLISTSVVSVHPQIDFPQQPVARAMHGLQTVHVTQSWTK